VTIAVLKPGLETTLQDYPGRVGMIQFGVPSSGPLDDWSFRLANLLVGNPQGACALECQFMGPQLRFDLDGVISVCGGDFAPTIEDKPISTWTSVQIQKGQTLSLGAARTGARAYLAIAGGFDVPIIMGSRATYVTARLGGVDGGPLKAGQVLVIGGPQPDGVAGRRVRSGSIPPLPNAKSHEIRVVVGPKDDWISEAGHRQFFESAWKLTSKSNRVGFRMQGPTIAFSDLAVNKDPENGDHPSNIIDVGYPIGGINWAGDTPIILMHDCLTLGGFIIPYTVPSCEFWRLAQARPGDALRFSKITVEDAQDARRAIDKVCTLESILDAP
jgi:5-oxoprolinase (ATP-hydrolysing) subunit C